MEAGGVGDTCDAEDGTLFVLGNLLLDMVLPVEYKYLESYNLVPDSIQTANENHLKMYTEVLANEDVVISPGGSALNTVRLAQRILTTPNKIVLLGAVGSDETGQLLVDTVQKEGIKLLAQKISEVATGRCASLLTDGGSQRTMITDLGASLKFSHDTWLKSEIDLEWMEKAQFVYISGYFLKVSSETANEVAKSVKRRGVPIILNLNAVWVTTSCKKQIEELLPFVNVLVGNEAEVKSFAKEMGLQSDKSINMAESENISQTACDLFLHMEKNRSKRSFVPESKVVIVTRGDLPVICVEKGKLKEFNVQCILKDDIVDSTGAGDAFVGGFLACYIQRKSLVECITCGIWAATEELKGYGFILPLEVPEQFKSA